MQAVLVTFKRNGDRAEFPLRKPVTRVGRGEDCSLRVPGADVSRQHCELKINNGALRIRDLESSNGTFVNNQRVREATLKAGDRIRIGPIVFTLQIDGRPQEIIPPSAGPAAKPKTAKTAAAVPPGPAKKPPAAPAAKPPPPPAVEAEPPLDVLEDASDSDLSRFNLNADGSAFDVLEELSSPTASDIDLSGELGEESPP